MKVIGGFIVMSDGDFYDKAAAISLEERRAWLVQESMWVEAMLGSKGGLGAEVLSIDPRRRSNAVLIADIGRMGRYLHNDMRIWDPTWGHGAFWSVWTPDHLTATDADADKEPPDGVWDVRDPWEDTDPFDAVVFDPPYKLNGTASDPDRPYGVDVEDTRDGRHDLMRLGLVGCIHSTKPNGWVLVKSQAQVNSGRKWWQPRMMAETAELMGCRQVDEFHFPAYRPQPADTSQVHARGNFSTLTVFQTPKQARMF